MGLRARAACYLDANIIIYLVEGIAAYSQPISRLRTQLATRHIFAVSSELTLCEVLPMPIRNGDIAGIAAYRNLLQHSGAIVLVPTTLEIYERAAAIRAYQRMKAPDAIHVATALEMGCAYFITNDASIPLPPSLEGIPLSVL